MRSRWLCLLLLLLWALPPILHAAEPSVVLRLERSIERPFGHMLGDLLRTEVGGTSTAFASRLKWKVW